jgi:hypothetical protein
VSDLTDTTGLVALGAGAIALIALAWAIALTVQTRRLRAAQRVVLGDGREDLVAHASRLQQAFLDLHDRVEEVAARLDERMATAEQRIDGAVAYRALVRYDAYGELSGHQSTTLALLDAERNGVVITSIAHRDSARMYCKQVVDGEGERELSPEEREAIRLALAGERRSVVLGS